MICQKLWSIQSWRMLKVSPDLSISDLLSPNYPSPPGALVANLSLLHENKRPGALTEHLIANHEAREAFLLSDAGLLFTSKPLDREDRDSYMVTIVLGRKGIIRGKQAVQVKVRRRQILVLFSNCVPASEKFNNSNDGIPLPRFVLLTRMTTVPALNNTSTRVTYLKTQMLAQKCYLPGKLLPQTPT